MHASALTVFISLALATLIPSNQPAPRATNSYQTEFRDALRAARVAEIYVIQGIEFPMTPTPDTVRESGCRYLVRRLTPQWADFEQAMSDARIRFRPTSMRVVSRVALILSDDRGTLLEIYADDGPWPDGRLTGFIDRHPVELSPSFLAALLGFIRRHPDLENRNRPELCWRESRQSG